MSGQRLSADESELAAVIRDPLRDWVENAS